MTMAEKVLAKASGVECVAPGQYVTASPDCLMLNDSFYRGSRVLDDLRIDRLHDPSKIVVVIDHNFPPQNADIAAQHGVIARSAKQYGIESFLGYAGVSHQVLSERGYAKPGTLVLGTDSHSSTYGAFGAGGAGVGLSDMVYAMVTGSLWMQVPASIRINMSGNFGPGITAMDISLNVQREIARESTLYKSIEFGGSVAQRMSIASRMTLANMGVELGAKFAFFESDDKTAAFLDQSDLQPFAPDPGAEYEDLFDLDVRSLSPQVARPDDPSNVCSVSDVGHVPVTQAYIGSCTNGRLQDIAVAANILSDHRVAEGTRLFVTPASREVYRDALQHGYVETLLAAGAHLNPPGCGACFGAQGGILGPEDVCVSTMNRNYRGRMGSVNAEIYLASAATVAASAIRGSITDPRAFWSGNAVEGTE